MVPKMSVLTRILCKTAVFVFKASAILSDQLQPPARPPVKSPIRLAYMTLRNFFTIAIRQKLSVLHHKALLLSSILGNQVCDQSPSSIYKLPPPQCNENCV